MAPTKTEIEQQIQHLSGAVEKYSEKLIGASENLQHLIDEFAGSLKTGKKKALPAIKNLLLEFEIWLLKRQLKRVEDKIQREYSKMKE